MTAEEFKQQITGQIPAKYLYISRNMYSVKGIPIYLIYFNSRIPNVKMSKGVINKQHTLKVKEITGRRMGRVSFSAPLLLDEYTREIRDNSLVLFIDLAGSYISRENSL